jgi:release factor glutamine methyltransferase
MPTLTELLRGSDIDAVDARVLLRTALAVDDVYLIAHADDAVSEQHAARFRSLAARRAAGEPVAYITGEREFYGHAFKVTPAVLIPRPETELLVELALQREPQHVLDLGTGSGCIAIGIALARAGVQVLALDRSPAALEVARDNAVRLNTRNVTFARSDWYGAAQGRRFDVIVSNPPYVAADDAHLSKGDPRYEPRAALAAGDNGFADIRAIITGAPAHLARGGWLLFEHGYDQAAQCRSLLAQAGFSEVQSWRDLAGIERVSGARAD